jgi:hypothetical protein
MTMKQIGEPIVGRGQLSIFYDDKRKMVTLCINASAGRMEIEVTYEEAKGMAQHMLMQVGCDAVQN